MTRPATVLSGVAHVGVCDEDYNKDGLEACGEISPGVSILFGAGGATSYDVNALYVGGRINAGAIYARAGVGGGLQIAQRDESTVVRPSRGFRLDGGVHVNDFDLGFSLNQVYTLPIPAFERPTGDRYLSVGFVAGYTF